MISRWRRPVSVRIVENRVRAAYSAPRFIVSLAVIAAVVWAAVAAVGQLNRRHAALEHKITSLEREGGTLADLARLRSEQLRPENVGWYRLAAAAALYAMALVASGFFWHECLLAFGQPVSRRITLSAHVLGQAGKYIPGKAMVILIRSAAVARHGRVRKIPAAIGVFVETLTMMACGATIAGLAVLMIPVPDWVRILAGLMAVAAAVPTLPPLFRRVLERLARGRFGKHASFSIEHYNWLLMARGWLWMTLVWLLIGGSFWLVVRATPGAAPEVAAIGGFATTTATICLAMVAGFLSLIPGGAGVRELVIMVTLAPLAGAGPAMVAAIIARLLFLAVEAAASGTAWLYLHRTESAALVTVD